MVSLGSAIIEPNIGCRANFLRGAEPTLISIRGGSSSRLYGSYTPDTERNANQMAHRENSDMDDLSFIIVSWHLPSTKCKDAANQKEEVVGKTDRQASVWIGLTAELDKSLCTSSVIPGCSTMSHSVPMK